MQAIVCTGSTQKAKITHIHQMHEYTFLVVTSPSDFLSAKRTIPFFFS